VYPFFEKRLPPGIIPGKVFERRSGTLGPLMVICCLLLVNRSDISDYHLRLDLCAYLPLPPRSKLAPIFSSLSPSRMIYPPACKLYGLEAEPEAITPGFPSWTCFMADCDVKSGFVHIDKQWLEI
jgi:hypothetical protein